jgi:hypothetical protein
MKISSIWKWILYFSVSLIILQGCNPMSIAIKGNDCKMNGSFETVNKGFPVNWRYYAPESVPNSDFSIISDSEIFKEGKRSLKFQIENCEAMGGWHSPGFFKEFKVVPGETYVVSFWIINKGCMFKAGVETGMKGNPGISETVIQTTESFSEWKYVEQTIQIPATNDNIRFEVNILSAGSIWFDDIRIEGVNDKSERTIYPYRGDEECK